MSAQKASGSANRKKQAATGRSGAAAGSGGKGTGTGGRNAAAGKAAAGKAAGRSAGGATGGGRAAQARHGQAAGKDTAGGRTALPDTRLRREIVGVLVAVLAIALFIAVVSPGTAILSRALSDVILHVIGLGAYILPFLMLVWAASFFVERGVASAAARLALGMALIFVSVLALAGLMTPDAPSSPDLVFEPAALMAHGGYVGGAVAWALLRLVGQGIALVILIGLVLVGAVLVGFSITGLVARVKALLARRRVPEAADEEGLSAGPYDLGGGPSGPYGEGAGRRQAAGKLIAPTAHLSVGLDPTHRFDDALFEGAQGRIPFDALCDPDAPDAPGASGDPDAPGISGASDGLGDLGSTRRSLVFADAAARTERLDRAALDVRTSDAFGSDRDALGGPDGPNGPDALRSDATVVLGGTGPGPASAKKGASAKRGAAAKKGAAALLPPEPSFELPGMRLLKASRAKASTRAGEGELRRTAAELQATIEEFGVDAQVEGWVAGPTVTLFKLSLGEGVRLSKINSLADDIALALAAPAVRIFSPIPGTTLVGIEVPNASRSMVLLGDVLPDAPAGPLQLAIGKDVEGDSIVADLEKMPHLLIGGTTGSGKSVAINAMIVSLLMRATPAQVRMILIDPKMVELSLYNDIPHLYVPVVTDAQKAAAALAWGVLEMERRLKVFQQAGVKNIAQYNAYVQKEREKVERERAERERAEREAQEARAAQEAEGAAEGAAEGGQADDAEGAGGGGGAGGPFGQRPGEDGPRGPGFGEDGLTEMPLIVIVIDELADLMMIAGKEVEISISRLAQLARAAGLHLIIATQRPSTNVITGLIKANIVNRIAFNVASGIDSRVILDGPGAEDLIGIGDLLFSRPEYGKPQRIQGCYVSEPEIEAVVDFLKAQGEPEYHEDILATAVGGLSVSMLGTDGEGGDDDPLVWEAADIVVSSNLGSTSTLQRRLKVGYARAGRIMDMLEHKGVVGPPNGSRPREVLIDDVLDLESLKALEQADSADW
ncbi:MAG: DNA translocase FtsK 4TM domain-containing protein [Coriobacteriales bacterium]|nr:DNA translocase FtsK 4TM domain-containing protein [Coriobacteriales bacterium]